MAPLVPVSKDHVLSIVNNRRYLHACPPVSWDPALQKSAEDVASKGSFEHSKTPGVSENLFLSTLLDTGLKQAVSEWYNEEKTYPYRSPGFYGTTGHFTALVWKESVRVGAAIARLNNGTFLYVMHLSPRGNTGQPRVYAANVPPRQAS